MSEPAKQDDIPDFQIPHPEKYKPTPAPEHTERWLRKDVRFDKQEEPKRKSER